MTEGWLLAWLLTTNLARRASATGSTVSLTTHRMSNLRPSTPRDQLRWDLAAPAQPQDARPSQCGHRCFCGKHACAGKQRALPVSRQAVRSADQIMQLLPSTACPAQPQQGGVRVGC